MRWDENEKLRTWAQVEQYWNSGNNLHHKSSLKAVQCARSVPCNSEHALPRSEPLTLILQRVGGDDPQRSGDGLSRAVHHFVVAESNVEILQLAHRVSVPLSSRGKAREVRFDPCGWRWSLAWRRTCSVSTSLSPPQGMTSSRSTGKRVPCSVQALLIVYRAALFIHLFSVLSFCKCL